MKLKVLPRLVIASLILAFFITGCITIVAKTEVSPTQPVSAEPTKIEVTPTPIQVTGVEPTQTKTVEPTQTKTVEPAQTKSVEPTQTPTPPAQVTFKEYTHKSNSFSLSYPADWKVSESTGSVSINSPDGSELMGFSAVNTGSQLDDTQFTNFVSAYEANDYAYFKNYKETKRDIQWDKKYAEVQNTLDINQIPYQVTTLYELKGKIIYIEYYATAISAIDKIGPIISEVDKSFKSNPAYAEDFVPYTTSLMPYHDTNNLFTINLPDTWTYQKANKNGIVQDIFTSPDGNAGIMIEETDLGKEVTRPVSDAEALKLVKDINSTARIAHIDTLKDGTKTDTIVWSWAPQNGSVQAVSLYKGNGTNLYMLTFIIAKGYSDIYQSAMNTFMNTYAVPQ